MAEDISKAVQSPHLFNARYQHERGDNRAMETLVSHVSAELGRPVSPEEITEVLKPQE